jgi:hypothetical protein
MEYTGARVNDSTALGYAGLVAPLDRLWRVRRAPDDDRPPIATAAACWLAGTDATRTISKPSTRKRCT